MIANNIKINIAITMFHKVKVHFGQKGNFYMQEVISFEYFFSYQKNV